MNPEQMKSYCQKLADLLSNNEGKRVVEHLTSKPEKQLKDVLSFLGEDSSSYNTAPSLAEAIINAITKKLSVTV